MGRKTVVRGEMQGADRRVLRTHRALREALFSLLLDMSWDDINIQDLCDKANVGRSTFYLHYQSKEDLLTEGFNDLRLWLTQHPATTAANGQPLPFVRGLIEHVHDHSALFRSVVGKRSGHAIQKRFRELILHMTEESMLTQKSTWQVEAGANVLSGALVELLAWWINSGKQQNADEIERLFFQLAQSLMRQLEE